MARAFLNICRHRGAQVAEGCGHTRRFTCPYHSWVYDTRGKLVGVPGRDTFGELDVSGLVELTTHEVAGVILAVLTPGMEFDPAEWMAGMDGALELLRLDELHRYPVVTELDSPNWKLTADGYVDGYHIGYLHSSTIGEKAITNRNTYDLFGPHVRIGFANKPINEIRDRPESEWPPMWEVMSMVHYIFPNVSISGQPDRPLMVSRLLPGPTPDRSTTVQYHFYRQPVEGDEAVATAEARRLLVRAGHRSGGLRDRFQDQPVTLGDGRRPHPFRSQRARQPEPAHLDRQAGRERQPVARHAIRPCDQVPSTQVIGREGRAQAAPRKSHRPSSPRRTTSS